ncbi:hypothetical protein CKO51_17650 [Rhodopirellula sp. SM50]|nr:hypothetical protein CKO51_17650 [Rhodopirellula sp. SM50]
MAAWGVSMVLISNQIWLSIVEILGRFRQSTIKKKHNSGANLWRRARFQAVFHPWVRFAIGGFIQIGHWGSVP